MENKSLDDKVCSEKTRLETARLLILRALYAARPIEAGETVLLRISISTIPWTMCAANLTICARSDWPKPIKTNPLDGGRV